ncbi:MAG: pilus assembly protein [Desulfuromonas sp.]|nr:pilus assembly protein [Desulfuromonas sp.]
MKNRCFTETQRGAAVVEFAIALLLLVTLVMGFVEFGLLFYNKQVLTNASREGARAGIVNYVDTSKNPSIDDIKAVVTAYCKDRLITFGAAVTPDPKPDWDGRDIGDNLTVTVDYTYTFLTPNLLGFGVTKTLTVKTVMKVEAAQE